MPTCNLLRHRSAYIAAHVVAVNGKARYHPEVVKSLKFVLPAVAAASLPSGCCVILLSGCCCRINLPLCAISLRQLVGDVLKVGAYVFGYLVIAKASLRFYILAEISQFTLLMVFAHWLIPAHGALGATQAYMATYIVYFSLCCGVFYSGVGGHDCTDSRTGIGYPSP